ncbi:hypothetical protein G6F57_020617 [Rhizopus arrhizus]|nr:hypothetical protein G6F57_020617 [Rhizopus arrhizus]
MDSQTAAAQGCAAQRRGAAVEALATEALAALSQRLNEAEGGPLPYRVVTSMLVPASIPASAERAKSEWDAVLLRQTRTDAATPVWDVSGLAPACARRRQRRLSVPDPARRDASARRIAQGAAGRSVRSGEHGALLLRCARRDRAAPA